MHTARYMDTESEPTGTHSRPLALRSRRCISMEGERAAAGKALFAPWREQDNALMVVEQGRVRYLGPYAEKYVPTGALRRDLGEVTVVPAAVNAHTHLQLSHLAGATVWGKGFVPWLASLIPLLPQPLEESAVREAMEEILASGTAYVADYTSHGMAMVGGAAVATGLDCTLLAEWIGFSPPDESSPWPPRCRPTLGDVPSAMLEKAVPCGHALYSTHAASLQAAQRWCEEHGRPFFLHLAEFKDEYNALMHGRGALIDFYTPAVLPPDWRAPGQRPVLWAASLGLLTPGTVAVHCVQCDEDDIALLATHGATVCLCPRSNRNLAVGEAPASAMARAGIVLCLGTDGRTSNEDLNVWNDAAVLYQGGCFPPPALLRMLTCNGAAALRLPTAGVLREGGPARWTILPAAWE